VGAWLPVCCECCVLSGRGLCDELITRPEESYQLWCVVVCDLEKQIFWMRRPRPSWGLSRQEEKIRASCWFWLYSNQLSMRKAKFTSPTTYITAVDCATAITNTITLSVVYLEMFSLCSIQISRA
jgi:hypothetical protein